MDKKWGSGARGCKDGWWLHGAKISWLTQGGVGSDRVKYSRFRIGYMLVGQLLGSMGLSGAVME